MITIVDSGVAAAISAAMLGANGTRAAGVATAIADGFGTDDVTLRVYSAADVLLCTLVCDAVTLDTASAVKTVTVGTYVSYTYAAAGAPSYVLWRNATDTVLRTSAGVGSGDVQFLANIAADVPLYPDSLRIRILEGLDGPTGFWISEPSLTLTLLPNGTQSYESVISSEYDLMAYSLPPDGVDVLPRSIVASSAATATTTTLIVGPDDWGYKLKPGETDGQDVAGGSSNVIDGTSWTWYQTGCGTKWRVPGGCWRDERGFAQSLSTIYSVAIPDTNTTQVVPIDVGWIVRRWALRPRDNYGIIVTGISGGTVTMGTRQTGQPATLTIERASGSTTYTVDVDVALISSSSAPGGASVSAIVVSNSGQQRALLYWDLDDTDLSGTITGATLTMTCVGQFASSASAPITIGAFLVTDPRGYQGTPAASTSKSLVWADGQYAGSDPDILYGCQFPGITQGGSTPSWMTANFSYITTHGWQRAYTINQSYSANGIQLPASSATGMLMRFPVGANLSNIQVYPFSMTYPFAKAGNSWTGRNSAFCHYRVCFGTDSAWSDNGKLVGFHGKLDLCGATVPGSPTDGNGGSPASSFGWSARGVLSCTAHGFMTDIVRSGGFYAYHMNQTGSYGDRWYTGDRPAGLFVPGRWYDVDMELVINTAGVANGVARMWVDDFLVYENTAVEWRPATVDSRLVNPSVSGSSYDLNIAGVWIAPEYGGTGTVPAGEGGHIAVTDFVVSTARIGKQP